MNDTQMEMWDALCELSGEEVARLFTDYHGNQLLDDGFRTFLGEEGVMPEVEEDDEDDEEDDEDGDEDEIDLPEVNEDDLDENGELCCECCGRWLVKTKQVGRLSVHLCSEQYVSGKKVCAECIENGYEEEEA